MAFQQPDPPPELSATATLPIVRLGDSSSHGGEVTGGSTLTTIDGVPQARSGDEFTCAVSTHNPATVGPGFISKVVDGGQDVAKQGDKTSCGATLIATQSRVKTVAGFIRITSPTSGTTF